MSRLAILIMDYSSRTHLPRYIIASLLGIQPSHLSEYENLRRPVPFPVMRKMCDLFCCEPSDILGMAEEGDDMLVMELELAQAEAE